MDWYFSRDDEKVGPLDDAEFYELVSRGIVSPETMVWNEGMSDWQPYKNASNAAKEKSRPAPAATESLLDPLPQSGSLLGPLPEQNLASMGSGRRPVPGAPVGLSYAGFWVRFCARMIDSFVLGAAMTVVFVIVGMLAVGAVSRIWGQYTISESPAPHLLSWESIIRPGFTGRRCENPLNQTPYRTTDQP